MRFVLPVGGSPRLAGVLKQVFPEELRHVVVFEQLLPLRVLEKGKTQRQSVQRWRTRTRLETLATRRSLS